MELCILVLYICNVFKCIHPSAPGVRGVQPGPLSLIIIIIIIEGLSLLQTSLTCNLKTNT